MFIAYTLIAFGACFLAGVVALSFIGSVLYLARAGAHLLWPAHEPAAALPLARREP